MQLVFWKTKLYRIDLFLQKCYIQVMDNTNPINNSTIPPVSTPSPVVASASISPSSVEVKPKTPLLVKIISWLMLLGGIFSLLGVLPFLLLGGLGKSGTVLLIGILNLVKGIGLVTVSFGIRRMRRWALYVFTIITVLAVIVSIYSFATSPKRDLTSFVDVSIQVLVLIYFWTISKRFI